MKQLIKKYNLIPAVVLAMATIVSYIGLFSTFYQQDEWQNLGFIMIQGPFAFLHLFSPISIIAGGGRILSLPIYYAFYNLFPFSTVPFDFMAIILHVLNSFVLFLIAKKLTKNSFISILAALFFVTASVASQAVSWVSANANTLPSAFFILLSLLLYFNYLENDKKKFLYSSFLSAFISFFFKESSIFLFFLLPLVHIIFSKKKVRVYEILKIHWVVILYGVIAVVARVLDLYMSAKGIASFVTVGANSEEKILFHFFLYPMESFSQCFIYPSFMWNLSEVFLKANYINLANSTLTAVIRQTISADMISITLSFIFFTTLAIAAFILKEYRKIIVFSIVFTLLSFLPFIVLDKGSAYLDSRYFYVGTIGAGIIFAIFLEFVRQMLARIVNSKVALILVSLLAIYFLTIQIKTIRSDINFQISLSTQKVNFLHDLTASLPQLPPKSIIYVTGDRDFYATSNKTPLQEGPGYTFMVWYYKKGNIPKELIAQKFLWDINSEGYKETGDGGFGYFYDLSQLQKVIKENNLNKNKVFGFYYQSGEEKLINITDEVRRKL